MGWYDFFSTFYDRSLEPLYLDSRARAAEALQLAPGHCVLDVPTGTGLSLQNLVDGVGPTGRVVGADLSRGMLARAARRVEANQWCTVSLLEADVVSLSAATLSDALDGRTSVDRLHVFLGMTAFPEPEAAFEAIWGLLAPGGRCVMLDCHDPSPGFQGKMVNLVARADITRRFWEPLEAVCEGFVREDVPSLPKHGGQLILAAGNKPR